MVTIAQIKAQIKRVNSGKDVDPDYATLRRLQKDFVKSLLESAPGGRIKINPPDVRHLKVKDFPKGFVIRVRKYRINCNEGKSTVWHVGPLKDVYTNQQPLYIREFLGTV